MIKAAHFPVNIAGSMIGLQNSAEDFNPSGFSCSVFPHKGMDFSSLRIEKPTPSRALTRELFSNFL
ncbi:MAG: hypothetical protein PWQ29_1579 [Verrucomicrobiota bacterium]|jgi:hypothetical protein|nr:hypothetical protein [Verrucomicrobiota bacterium]